MTTFDARGRKLKSDLTGEKFGRLFVVSFSHMAVGGNAYWLAACSCGSLSNASTSNLRKTNSCGCFAKEQVTARSLKHGNAREGRKTRIWRIWIKMRDRCYGKSDAAKYAYYGARGIRVCDEWNTSFKAFRDWAMSNGYTEHLTIDRINTNGNYEPANCRWATMLEQRHNRRDSAKQETTN